MTAPLLDPTGSGLHYYSLSLLLLQSPLLAVLFELSMASLPDEEMAMALIAVILVMRLGLLTNLGSLACNRIDDCIIYLA